MDIEEAIDSFRAEYESSEHWDSDLIIEFEVAEAILNELDKKDKEIKYWKEQAEGYQGLVEQIKEDFENRDRWE